MRRNLQSVYAQTGVIPSELQIEPPQDGLLYLLDCFYALSSGRQCGMALNPIAWSDIKAWCDLSNVSFDAWELSAVKQLDAVFLDVFGKKED